LSEEWQLLVYSQAEQHQIRTCTSAVGKRPATSGLVHSGVFTETSLHFNTNLRL